MDEEREERMFAKMEQQVAKAEIQLKGMNDKDRQWFQTMKQRRDERERLTNNFKTNAQKAADGGAEGENGGAAKQKEDRFKKLSESKQKKITKADKKKSPSQLFKERHRQNLEKGSLLRAKAAKVQKKPQKLRSVHDPDDGPKQSARKPRASKFAQDLTDTSRRGAKRLRYTSIFTSIYCCPIFKSTFRFFFRRHEANQFKKTAKINSKKKTSNVKITNKAGMNKFNKGKNFSGPKKQNRKK